MQEKSGDSRISERKKDHIQLAFEAQVRNGELDRRFSYEPMMNSHPRPDAKIPSEIAGKTLDYPIWVSSMTGGTDMARTINQRLAKMCGEFGLGMGLGSCRILLDDDKHFSDFDVRELIGPNRPLFANLGVAQVESLLAENSAWKIESLLEKLRADGLIVHVNPLQEWLQPGGDRFTRPPIRTISDLVNYAQYPVIVKEVGQGMGASSLKALLKLPLAAVEFAAHGGTNFAKLELLRSDPLLLEAYSGIAAVGHDAKAMVDEVNALTKELGDERKCERIIVSGGVRNFLDGYYLMKRLTLPSVYGQASSFLQYAQDDYDKLKRFASLQIEGLKLAYAFLTVKEV